MPTAKMSRAAFDKRKDSPQLQKWSGPRNFSLLRMQQRVCQQRKLSATWLKLLTVPWTEFNKKWSADSSPKAEFLQRDPLRLTRSQRCLKEWKLKLCESLPWRFTNSSWNLSIRFWASFIFAVETSFRDNGLLATDNWLHDGWYFSWTKSFKQKLPKWKKAWNLELSKIIFLTATWDGPVHIKVLWHLSTVSPLM